MTLINYTSKREGGMRTKYGKGNIRWLLSAPLFAINVNNINKHFKKRFGVEVIRVIVTTLIN